MIPHLVTRLQELIREHHPLPDRAVTAAALLDDLGPLPVEQSELAALLTERLRSPGGDPHLAVRVAAADDADRWAREALAQAGGVASLTRVGRTAVLTVAPYLSDVGLAAPYVEAAFALVRGAEALVIDVREGHGGTPETVALVCSHLLGPAPVHLQDVLSSFLGDRALWTTPAPVRFEGPVAVVTSAGTFSACEELAYDLQALGRATVIGETTAGGAHPVEVFALTDRLQAWVPVGRPVNAVTGTSWEGTGVVPDVACPAGQALGRALQVTAGLVTRGPVTSRTWRSPSAG